MAIHEEMRDDVAILKLKGSLMIGPEVAPFHDRIKDLVRDGITKVIVDFSDVKWFGSAMLGVLAASLTTLRNAGGDLRLVGVTKKIDSILMVTKLASTFKTFRRVEAAVVSFKEPVVEKEPVAEVA